MLTPETKLDELLGLISGPRIDPSPFETTRLVLYGAGKKGVAYSNILRNAGYQVEAFIDKVPRAPIDGLEVLPLGGDKARQLAASGAICVVTVWNPRVALPSVYDTLSAFGFRRVVTLLELLQHFPAVDCFWAGSLNDMLPTVAETDWLWSRLADNRSKEVLFTLLSQRHKLGRASVTDKVDSGQYSPPGVPLPTQSLRFIDGGAFTGDTLQYLLTTGASFESIAAFEPDPVNFYALARFSKTLKCRDVSLWPCGLGEVLTQLRFSASGLDSSAFDEAGQAIAQVVALDDVLPNFKPTYVKLDVEGAEFSAIQGMSSTLEACRPAMAVCLYHRPADLWVLPSLVDRLIPEAALYLRVHALNGFETVLYVVP